MKNTGAILGWKFNHAPGICTIDGVITEWPAALGPVPTQAQLNSWAAEYDTYLAARQAQKNADAVAHEEVKADSVIQYLRDHTPAECEAYVQTNVTDLASARAMMKKFAVVLCVLAKQNLR